MRDSWVQAVLRGGLVGSGLGLLVLPPLWGWAFAQDNLGAVMGCYVAIIVFLLMLVAVLLLDEIMGERRVR